MRRGAGRALDLSSLCFFSSFLNQNQLCEPIITLLLRTHLLSSRARALGSLTSRSGAVVLGLVPTHVFIIVVVHLRFFPVLASSADSVVWSEVTCRVGQTPISEGSAMAREVWMLNRAEADGYGEKGQGLQLRLPHPHGSERRIQRARHNIWCVFSLHLHPSSYSRVLARRRPHLARSCRVCNGTRITIAPHLARFKILYALSSQYAVFTSH